MNGWKLYTQPGLCPSFSEWPCQIMLPVGQLAEHLSVAKVQSYSTKGTRVGVGGVGVWGPHSGHFYLWECPESGFQAIWSSEPFNLRALSSTALRRWIISLFIQLCCKLTASTQVLKSGLPGLRSEKQQLTLAEREGGGEGWRWRRREVENERGGERESWRGREVEKKGGREGYVIACTVNHFALHDHDRQTISLMSQWF